jgi:hypothetical protein
VRCEAEGWGGSWRNFGEGLMRSGGRERDFEGSVTCSVGLGIREILRTTTEGLVTFSKSKLLSVWCSAVAC